VFHGNRLKPTDTKSPPKVKFAGEQSLWTLVLTNPDGNMKEELSETVHWMV
jgi:large subunit ribosomal protein L38